MPGSGGNRRAWTCAGGLTAPPGWRAWTACIAAAEQERAAALVAVAAAREALQAAWRDREVLVQLRARREREWAEAQRRRETAELDEIGGQRRARARRIEVAG